MAVAIRPAGGLMPDEVEALARSMARVEAELRGMHQVVDAKFVTLKTVVDSNAATVKLALEASERAITKAETAADKRFDLLNELRDDVATHAEVESIEKQLTALKERLDKLEGAIAGGASRMTDQRAAIGVAVGIAVLILSIVVFAANIITQP